MARTGKHADIGRIFWQNVQKLRQDNRGQKFSWNDIASKLGMTQQTLSSYCAHHCMPKLDLALDIADILGVSLITLLDDKFDGKRMAELSADEQEILTLLSLGNTNLYKYKVNAVRDVLKSLNAVEGVSSPDIEKQATEELKPVESKDNDSREDLPSPGKVEWEEGTLFNH